MSKLPTLLPLNPKRPDGTDSVVLAVYAPFGTDEVLSMFPDGTRKPIGQQPLVSELRKVARLGVHVSALIDLFDDFSYLVEIPAGLPGQLRVYSTWKQDMTSPYALEGFLRHTLQHHPCAALVLAIEGHGAGFLPDLDTAAITPLSTSDNGKVNWQVDPETVNATAGGPPLLGVGYPELPVPAPNLPHLQMPMSTWALGAALRRATAGKGARKPAVIHFNNCFNLSLEVLHTVAAYADYATSYGNYNFFTAGAAYPKVFARLRAAGSATREQLARWFALENQSALSAPPFFPTVGGAVRLSRMRGIVAALNTLAAAMTAELRTAPNRDVVVQAIRHAIVDTQQYDTGGGYELETPDQLTDVMSLARSLQKQPTLAAAITQAAAALEKLLAGIKQYGDNLLTSVNTAVKWDFSSEALALNILLPDPALQGRWDWRSPYYGVGPSNVVVQPNVIPFLTPPAPGVKCPWVEFLIEYHKDVRFVGLLRALPPFFPTFDRRFDPAQAKPIPRPGAVSEGPDRPKQY